MKNLKESSISFWRGKVLKYWWFYTGAILLIIVYAVFLKKPTVEYTELSQARPVKGNLEAGVVLVEYSDFQCPACGAAAKLLAKILPSYLDKIKFEYRHFPLVNSHRWAKGAAEAAECALDQGKFWEYHDLLFAHQNSLAKADLENYAAQAGLNVELWNDCLSTHAKRYAVEKDLAAAKSLRLPGTPSFFLNNQLVDDWQKLPELLQGLVQPLVPLQNNNQ